MVTQHAAVWAMWKMPVTSGMQLFFFSLTKTGLVCGGRMEGATKELTVASVLIEGSTVFNPIPITRLAYRWGRYDRGLCSVLGVL